MVVHIKVPAEVWQTIKQVHTCSNLVCSCSFTIIQLTSLKSFGSFIGVSHLECDFNHIVVVLTIHDVNFIGHFGLGDPWHKIIGNCNKVNSGPVSEGRCICPWRAMLEMAESTRNIHVIFYTQLSEECTSFIFQIAIVRINPFGGNRSNPAVPIS